MKRTLELNAFANIMEPLLVPSTILVVSPFLLVMLAGAMAIEMS